MTAPYVQEAPSILKQAKARMSLAEGLLLGGLGGSAIADYGTTLAGLKRGAHEANPVLAPFTNHGPIPLALLQGGLSAMTALSAHELKKRGSKFWWVPPVLGIVGHGIAALHNSRLK